jgi:hypothetical protein
VSAGENDIFDAGGTRSAWILRNDLNAGGGFVDVGPTSGLYIPRFGRLLGRPGEVNAFGDVDNDGDLDVFAGVDSATSGNPGGETSEIFLNESDDSGVRFRVGEGADVRRDGLPDLPASASFFDVDRDGLLDLWVTEHNYAGLSFVGNRLYQGDGTGAFADVTADLGLQASEWDDLDAMNAGLAHTRSWSGAACDLNGDGDLELLSASYGRAPNHLWQAVRDAAGVRYENRSVASGYAYDDNFVWQDNQFAACFCDENPDAEGCADVGQSLLQCSDNWDHDFDREAFRLGGNSATTLCADLDGDGDLDLVTTEIRHWWAGGGSDAAEILENVTTDDGAVTFVRPGRDATGIIVPHGGVDWDEGIMTAGVLDVDNDGLLDLYLGGSDYPGNRGMLFRQTAPLRFEPVDVGVGIDHTRSHGFATADFDGDGDLDVIVGHSRSRCDADCYDSANVRYFENVVGNRGNYVQLALVGGAGTNKSAIGARVTVRTGDTSQVQEVGGGYGHFGAQNDLTLHYGVGDACSVDVTVRWPDAALSTETFTLPVGERHVLVQGEGAALN